MKTREKYARFNELLTAKSMAYAGMLAITVSLAGINHFVIAEDHDQVELYKNKDVNDAMDADLLQLQEGASELLMQSWLMSAKVDSWCADEPHLALKQEDISPAPNVQSAQFVTEFSNEVLVDPNKSVLASLCIDPNSIEINENFVSVDMISDPEIFREGQEDMPSIFLTLTSKDASEVCKLDKEIMRNKLLNDIDIINDALGNNEKYEVSINVSNDYDVSHPCND